MNNAPQPAVTLDDDAFHHECGVCGVFGHTEAANLTYLGLYALQHRGQEAAGVTSCDGTLFHTHRGMGRVADVFGPEDMGRLNGKTAIGHVRYSTSGASVERNAQPLVIDYQHGGLAMAHNGNLVNARALRQDLERQGSIFQTEMDTEVIIHLVARAAGANVEERLANALREVKGAYTLVALTETRLVGARDPVTIEFFGSSSACICACTSPTWCPGASSCSRAPARWPTRPTARSRTPFRIS